MLETSGIIYGTYLDMTAEGGRVCLCVFETSVSRCEEDVVCVNSSVRAMQHVFLLCLNKAAFRFSAVTQPPYIIIYIYSFGRSFNLNQRPREAESDPSAEPRSGGLQALLTGPRIAFPESGD